MNLEKLTLEMNREVLRQAHDYFTQYVEVDGPLLTYLTSHNPPIVTILQRRELDAAPGPQAKLDKLILEILMGVENSVDVLIEYFRTRHLSQGHVLRKLEELKKQELEKHAQPNSPGMAGPSQGRKLTSGDVMDLTVEISKSPVAIDKWSTVSRSLNLDPIRFKKFTKLVRDSEIEEAINYSLEYYIELASPTVHDFVNILRNHNLNQLADAILRRFGQ